MCLAPPRCAPPVCRVPGIWPWDEPPPPGLRPVPQGCTLRVCPISREYPLSMCPVPLSCALGCSLGCSQCLWDEPYVPNAHPRTCPGLDPGLCSRMRPVPCSAPWDALCAVGCALCVTVCPGMCSVPMLCAPRCAVRPGMCPRMRTCPRMHVGMLPRIRLAPQRVPWAVPGAVPSPPGSTQTPNAVSPQLILSAGVTRVFPHWRGVHGVLHHWGGGLQALDPPPPISSGAG